MQTHRPENDDGVFELVEVEVRARADDAVVTVRSLRSGEALLQMRCRADETAAAVLRAERFCAERALPLLMRPRRAA